MIYISCARKEKEHKRAPNRSYLSFLPFLFEDLSIILSQVAQVLEKPNFKTLKEVSKFKKNGVYSKYCGSDVSLATFIAHLFIETFLFNSDFHRRHLRNPFRFFWFLGSSWSIACGIGRHRSSRKNRDRPSKRDGSDHSRMPACSTNKRPKHLFATSSGPGPL